MAVFVDLPPGVPHPEWITIQQAEAIANIGKTTIFSLVANGVWESCKVGRRRLIKYRSMRDDLDRRAAG